MKLPDELLQNDSLGFSRLPSPFDRDRYEAIVRNCAKVCKLEGARQLGSIVRVQQANLCSDAILARYGLEPK